MKEKVAAPFEMVTSNAGGYTTETMPGRIRKKTNAAIFQPSDTGKTNANTTLNTHET